MKRHCYDELKPYADPDLNKESGIILPVNLTANCYYHFQNDTDPTNFRHPLKLLDLLLYYDNIKFDRKSFAAAIARYASPKSTVLNFASSKTVCVGADSFEKARLAFQLQRYLIEKIPHPDKPFEPKYLARTCDISVCNYVINVNMGHFINLTEFTRQNGAHVTYEPSIFPAAIYRDESQVPVAVLVFDSGHIIITQPRQIDDAQRILTPLTAALAKCKTDQIIGDRHRHRLLLHRGQATLPQL